MFIMPYKQTGYLQEINYLQFYFSLFCTDYKSVSILGHVFYLIYI